MAEDFFDYGIGDPSMSAANRASISSISFDYACDIDGAAHIAAPIIAIPNSSLGGSLVFMFAYGALLDFFIEDAIGASITMQSIASLIISHCIDILALLSYSFLGAYFGSGFGSCFVELLVVIFSHIFPSQP